ncbi:MAG: CRISPR-associated endonuclease Cas1, partial [Phascolarctobacterium sp.]|nr:CRISPR-associated endonuclease Cas1 [Candidatus Phascolarctobacterium caballi]
VISRKYYEGFSCLMPTEFQFEKRTRRPPKDEVNAMLSMGYSMLFNEILANANLCGLHPYIGFLHRIKEGHAALVSDLMEEWRTIIVDTTVLNMIKRQIIKKEMFRRENNGCFFTKEGLKIFLSNYHKKLITDVEYLGNGATYRDLLKRQCQKYVSVVLNDKSEYYTAMEIR